MARGWESKSVEAQIEEAKSQPEPKEAKADPELVRRRRGLELNRSRLQQDIARSTHPAHRQQLEAALAEIERQLAALEPA